MNVVRRETRINFKRPYAKKGLIRKDPSIGIRGTSSLPLKPFNNVNSIRNTSVPKYNFDAFDDVRAQRMGPPTETPKAFKRKLANNSTSSTKLGSSINGRGKIARVLASDSGQADTSHDFQTSHSRPTALRYISSSSRGGGHSGTHSVRSASTSIVEPSIILAISEGRGMARGEIGIAAVDLKHPQLTLCQFSDTLLFTHTLTKINYFNPVEIIVPHTFCEGVQPNQLYQLIKDQYPLINLTTVQRRHFNDAAGRQQIQTLCAPEYSAVCLQVLHKFYALTAAAAVLKYVEYIQCVVFARESLKIKYHSSENTMLIDVGTATQLELVQPLIPSAGPSCCLLGVLGPTYTIGGIRALRATILQPSCKREFIETRLDAIQELIESDAGLMSGLQDIIKKLADIDKILLLCIESPMQNIDKIGESQLNQTLLLKTTMDLVPTLVEALNTASSGKLRKIKMDFENPQYKEISDRIHTVIHDDAHAEKGAMGSLQRCFAVKPDINGLLDVARKTYSELIEDIQKIVEQLSETYDLPIRLHQNVMKGFHIVLPIAPKNRINFKVEDLPPIFIQVQNTGASVSMTTEELVVMDQQTKESLKEVQKLSNIVISGLLKELRPFMSSLYKLCENVAELDILLALAQASSVGSYIRPEFSDFMNIRNSVHPLLDYNSQVLPVPNDISATPEHNFVIITGPNMGGKSIYIKQIAIMQIMAQLGCFLPATNATLRLCDRLFSRMGFNDSIELNASTYVLEMKDIQHILKGLTPSSLVIIDELCRGTCSEEGASVAWAVCEELLISKAFTFFTTHFTYLTRLQEVYFNVVNLHTMVTEEIIPNTQDKKRLVYEHKIETGINKIEHYGLYLAANTNLPKETVNLAQELADFMIKIGKSQEIQLPEKNDERLLYQLNADIRKEVRRNEIPGGNIRQLIINFKQSNPGIIDRLKVQHLNSTDSINSITSSSNIPKNNIEVAGNKTKLSNEPSTSILYRPVNKVNKIIYSTSDDLEDYNDLLANGTNITSVTTNNDLLNTVNVMNETEISDKNISMFNLDSENRSNEDVLERIDENVSVNEHSNNLNISNGDITDNSMDYNDDNFYTNNEENIQGNCSNDNSSSIAEVNDVFDSDRESELAKAMTQIIVECDNKHQYGKTNNEESPIKTIYSQHVHTQMIDINIRENKEDTNSYISSNDGTLMEETIKEINEELSKTEQLENIILTPPIGFRD